MRKPFLQLVSERVVVLDGAMGTAIHNYPLDVHKDYQGHENCTDILVETRPDVIQEIHESYLAVGCDAVETDTFGANKIVLSEFGIPEKTFELNKRAAQIARQACLKFETPDRPRYVVGSMGPGTKLPTLGNTTFDILVDSYSEQCRGLIAGGADVLLIETNQDLLLTKAAINAATMAMKEAGAKLPLMVQVTIEAFGTMLVGSDTSAVVASILPYEQVDVLGLNCATGPTEMGEHVQYLSHHWPKFLSVLPNAGLPVIVDGQASYPLTPKDFAAAMMRFVDEYGVNIVGGCCGTTPEHLKVLIEALKDGGGGSGVVGSRSGAVGRSQQPPTSDLRPPTPDPRPPTHNLLRSVVTKPQVASLYNAEDIRQDNSYLIIAERTNTNGSKKFRTLLQNEDWDGLVSMARDEVRDGSHMLDVCVDFVGRDGMRDMHQVISRYVRQIRAPFMLDSTDAKVMEEGLKLVGGRCVLNSMNLEDGEERIERICALAKKYGAAVVAGTIDEDKTQAMARTAERKIAIAKRIRDLAVDKYGLRDEDLMFDPLVLPISTGIEEDRRNALETIKGTSLISQQLPQCHTVVGLSNVSFGLKPAARVVLNSVFLHELREAGLTGAIVHASKILPRNRISDERWNAALDLIHDRRRDGFDPLTHFIDLFPEGTETAKAPADEKLPIEEKLKRHIIDGEKRDLTVHLDEAMKTYKPLDIINNILLEGMKVVGDLFGSGQMQLPFVLQSAETMKASVAHLEPHMERVEGQTKGKIVLATVKGDVHDIGKNLVDIILTNNGYTVYNLGIKQPVNDILRAFEEKKADAIGMSGLLVKSVGVMKENLEEMNAHGVRVPVLLGGAALTRSYAESDLASLYKGPLFYCKDAFEGLHTMDRVIAGESDKMVAEQRSEVSRRQALREKAAASRVAPQNLAPRSDVARDNPVPTPPFLGRRVVRDIPAEQLFPFINPLALFRGQWGFKKGRMSEEEFERSTDEQARPVFEALQQRALKEKLLDPKVVYGYFPVQSQGEDLIVYRPEDFSAALSAGRLQPSCKPSEWMRFSFPRQESRRRMCISDFFRDVESGQYDVLGVQLVTVGDRASEVAQELFAANKYQEYLYLHGFGVESAEGLAELWHKRMRQELGFGSEDSPRIKEIFQQGYRGSRFSFGYGACPSLEDRAKIVQLLDPAEIGVSLSENFMLVPEQSTDAIVVHHPQAKYFDT